MKTVMDNVKKKKWLTNLDVLTKCLICSQSFKEQVGLFCNTWLLLKSYFLPKNGSDLPFDSLAYGYRLINYFRDIAGTRSIDYFIM